MGINICRFSEIYSFLSMFNFWTKILTIKSVVTYYSIPMTPNFIITITGNINILQQFCLLQEKVEKKKKCHFIKYNVSIHVIFQFLIKNNNKHHILRHVFMKYIKCCSKISKVKMVFLFSFF